MLKNKCCLYIIISIRFFSITICNLLIEFPSQLQQLHFAVRRLQRLCRKIYFTSQRLSQFQISVCRQSVHTEHFCCYPSVLPCNFHIVPPVGHSHLRSRFLQFNFFISQSIRSNRMLAVKYAVRKEQFIYYVICLARPQSGSSEEIRLEH